MKRTFLSVILAVIAAVTYGKGASMGKMAAVKAIVEVVPTARQQPGTWHYTFGRPADNWMQPRFDDRGWKSGRGGFGTAGTPRITLNSDWATPEIWLRREITLPDTGLEPSTLQLLVFHDEDVEIYFDGVLAAQQDGFVADYEPMEILPDARQLLKPGAKILLAVHCRQTAGGQGIDVGLASVPNEIIAGRRKDRYRAFAMSNAGNSAAGQKLFADEGRLACSRCHTTDATSGRAGPDLFAVGDKFPRIDLINAVLEPSATVAVGYATTVVKTKKGDAILGVLKEATDDHLGLMTGDGQLQRVAVADVRARRTQDSSLMPDGLESGLSPQQFADLIAYLASLRLPEVADAGRRGMPSNILELRPAVGLVPIHSEKNRFQHPCWFGQIRGVADAFLVCEHQTGHVWRLSTARGNETKILWGDFGREVRGGSATGLLGLAFHPRFRENRKYYLQHQLVVDGRIVARISEKLAAPDLVRDSGRPSRTIIEFPCSTDVHSGGGIEFGPDGFLYIAMGDTGPQGDPQGHGQDVQTLLGKVLRIDVDREESGTSYAIPRDNPFRSRPGVRPEIWAYGFREPWRFSFDPATGDLWVGDVGQDRIEEVGIVRAGENHGWNVYEGFDLFSIRFRREGQTWVPPVFAYDRRLGNSITGGYVYRGGAADSPFRGVYICADFTSRRVWGLKQQDRKLSAIWQLCLSPQSVASFGRDDAGALYLVGYEGTIFKLDFTSASLSGPPGR